MIYVLIWLSVCFSDLKWLNFRMILLIMDHSVIDSAASNEPHITLYVQTTKPLLLVLYAQKTWVKKSPPQMSHKVEVF